MLIGALGFFILAVMLGAYLLSLVFRRKTIPKAVAMTHGLFAAIGLVLLVIYPFYHTPSPMVSLIVLIFVAMGGIMMAYKSVSGKSVPVWLALGHGVAAIIGVVALVAFMLA